MLIVGTLLPAVARASIISDLWEAVTVSIRGNIAEADTIVGQGNSQNIELPKGTINSGKDIGGGAIIIADSALVPDDSVSNSYSRPANSTISTHVVKPGETISGIAEMYEVSADTILWANDLSRKSVLKSGQTLTILPVTGIIHTVAMNETISSIATTYKGDISGIMSYNGLEDTNLVVGDKLIIPDGEIKIEAPTPAKKIVVDGKKIATTIPSGYYSSPLAKGTYEKTQGIHGYNGVDLGAPAGTPIYASAAGDVIVAKQGGYNGGYGSYVVIQHDNGSQTLYAHQTSVQTSVGARVAKGQQIGTVGNSGRVSGPTGYHLHFEIRNGVRNPF